MRKSLLLAFLATTSVAFAKDLPFHGDGIVDIPSDLSRLPSELQCPKIFPSEKCFQEHADCFAFRKPFPDHGARSISVQDADSNNTSINSFFAGDAFSCERLKDVNEAQFQDCLLAQNVSKPFTHHISLIIIGSTYLSQLERPSQQERPQRNDTTLEGRNEAGLPVWKPAHPPGWMMFWDPECCRLTPVCYEFMEKILKGPPEVSGPFFYTKESHPDISKGISCCMALLASSCRPPHEKQNFQAPREYNRGPACSNPGHIG